MKLIFLDRVLENIETLNFMKIRPMQAELFHAEGRTDSRFLQFCERTEHQNTQSLSIGPHYSI